LWYLETTWLNAEDYQNGGFWVLMHINLSKDSPRSKRVNISMPDDLLERIDKAAQERE